MKKYYLPLMALIGLPIFFSCSRSAEGQGGIDSIKIARIIVEKYPDTIPQIRACMEKNFGFNLENNSNAWLLDSSKTESIVGPNYFLAINKSAAPVVLPGEIDSDDGTEKAVNFESRTRAFKGDRSYFVEFSKQEFLAYL